MSFASSVFHAVVVAGFVDSRRCQAIFSFIYYHLPMDEEKNPREELYKRFKESLSHPVSQRYFDEDELIDLYDYAGDLHDDYVQLEILLCGARLYPESHGLSERRLLFYLDTSDDNTDQRTEAAAKYLADNPDASSLLFDIARMETSPGDDHEASLEYILHQYETFDDEEIIRFVDLAIDLGQYGWLVENLDKIAEKVPYKPTLYFEVAREADNSYDNETLVKVADQLIELEPFTTNYWIMLFRGQARLDRRDEARTTYDSAKALAADDPVAMLGIADAVYTSAPYLLSDMANTLKAIKEQYQDDFDYTDAYCAMLVQLGNVSMAVNEIKAFLDRHPVTPRAVRQLLMCNSRDCKEYVERFFNNATEEQALEFDIENLAQTLNMRGAHYSVDALMSMAMSKNMVFEPYFSIWMESLFALGKYGEVVELGNRSDALETTLQTPLKGASMAYIYTASLLKTGRYDKAVEYVAKVRPRFERNISDLPLPLRLTLRAFLSLADVIDRKTAEDNLYWEYFDQLSYGKF